MVKRYRTKDGTHTYKFAFTSEADHVAITCLSHPPLNGHDPSARNTHLFSSGRLCFVTGQEPRTQARAEKLASDWAEYFLNYCRTGTVRN